MVRQLKIQPRNDEERRVIGSWRISKISNNAIVIYLSWVRRFRSYCDHYGLDESKQLTLKGVTKFCSKYVGPRIGNSLSESSRNIARTSLHTWARTLQMLGDDLPRWDKQPKKKKHSLLVEEFLEYRRHHSGVSEATLKRDADIAQKFLAHLRIHGKSVRTASAVDTDTFLATLIKCNSKRTVANLFSALRGFLRYLHMNNRLRMNLADLLAVPRVRRMEHPPRALPWSDVRRLLRAIDRDCPHAEDLAGFLAFKRSLGFRYTRSEFTLREFDRYIASRPQLASHLDSAMLSWLSDKPNRKPVSVSMDAAVLREFCKYLARRYPQNQIPKPIWPRLPTTSDFVPYVFSVKEIKLLLDLAGQLDRPAFRSVLYRTLLLVLYCTGLRFGEALRLQIGDVDMSEEVLFVREFKGRSRWASLYLRGRGSFKCMWERQRGYGGQLKCFGGGRRGGGMQLKLKCLGGGETS